MRPEQKSQTEEHDREELPLSYARALSWVSLTLILCMSLGLAVIITNSARERLLTKQTDFALLLAENLNHQIYRRFTLPTVLAFGRIALRQPTQYERLDQIVLSVIHGWQLKNLRIYDFQSTVAYSTDKEELGDTEFAGPAVVNALHGGTPEFEIISAVPVWRAFFTVPLEPGTFVLRTTFPLRIEARPGASSVNDEPEIPTMGVLEFSQDITGDFESVVTFQRLIVGAIMLSAAVLFSLLLFFIRRADRALTLRIAQNRALEENLRMSERLASMGRVVASIAHEIRNPLGIIRSSAELLLRRADTADPRTSGILQAVFDEAVRLSQTVNDFLDYARPRQPRLDVVEIDQIIDQLIAFQAGEFERLGVGVHIDLEDGLKVKGDKDLLYRALYNLIANAIQAVNGPGSLYFSGRKNKDGLAELTLIDSGPGFAPELIPRLLDPFFTTKDNGTGLGLPIVNSIITSHGGRLVLENAPERGASARIFLPAA